MPWEYAVLWAGATFVGNLIGSLVWARHEFRCRCGCQHRRDEVPKARALRSRRP